MNNLLSTLMALILATGTLVAQEDSVSISKKGIYIRDGVDEFILDRTGIHVRDHMDTVDVAINLGKKRPRNVITRWGMLDLGFQGLDTKQNNLLDNGIDPWELRGGNSTNVNIHLMRQRFNLIKHHVGLSWGLTFEFHKYMFENPVVMLEDKPQVEFQFNEGVEYKKNRLSMTYFTVPVMFNYESDPKNSWKSFHLSAGAYAGLRLGSNFKTKVKGDKDKVRDDFGLNQWRYGARAEIGSGPITFYGTMAFNDLFDDKKNGGYEMTPFSVGLVIVPF